MDQLELRGGKNMNIYRISKNDAINILARREPIGLFICKEENYFIGIDNSTGDCWTEEFESSDLCIKWLRGEKGGLDR
jgi:hypothetical protein